MERDRQGVMRFFQGSVMKPVEGMPTEAAEQESETVDVAASATDLAREPEPEVVDGDVLREVDAPPIIDVEESSADAPPAYSDGAPRGRRRRTPKAAAAAKPVKEKKPARARAPRKKAPSVVGV